MPPRGLKLTRVRDFHHDDLLADRVPTPPKDQSWIDRYQIHRSHNGYPQVSINAEPKNYDPFNAPSLKPQQKSSPSHLHWQHPNHFLETYHRSKWRDYFDRERNMCIICFMLFLILLLLVILMFRK